MITFLSMIIIFLLIAVDQLTKVIMQIWLLPKATSPFIPHVVQFTYAENTGAAFGSFQNARWFFITATAIVCVAILYFMLRGKIKSGVIYTSFVFIVAGGLGNLIDRVFRGYVIDFIEPTFMRFAIFNFADCLVSVGAVIFLSYMIWEIVQDGKKTKKKKLSEEKVRENNDV